MRKDKFALVTGASEGLGYHFALELAKMGKSLFLVALPHSDLSVKSERIAQDYGVTVDYCEIDLTLPEAPQRIFELCRDKGYAVDILINNAGMGYTDFFESNALVFYQKLIRLNNESLVSMTRVFLPMLKNNAPAHLMNVASLGGFFDMPYKAVYAASKGFVISFSNALRWEIQGEKISISTLCPAGVNTRKNIYEITDKIGSMAQRSSMNPDLVAKIALQGLFKKRKLILPGKTAKVSFFLSKVFPRPFQSFLIYRKLKKVLGEPAVDHLE